MARKKGKSKVTRRRRRRSIGGLAGKSITLQMTDLLWVGAGVLGNYLGLNPLLNQVTKNLKKKDGSPMLGEHQAKFIIGAKGGGAAYAAYSVKSLPKEVRLALLGVSAASALEMAGQFLDETQLVVLNGTGDLYIGSSTPLIEIPMRSRASGFGDDVVMAGVPDDGIATAGMGDLVGNDFGFSF